MSPRNNRILVVDDNASIHEDYRKILLSAPRDGELDAAEAVLFAEEAKTAAPKAGFELVSAMQGEEGIELAAEAVRDGDRFSLAFVDVRMPPGIDGIATVIRLWEVDPELQVVVCSAFSDYSWSDMAAHLGTADRWVILKKPFDNIEVLQLAHALTEKWALRQQTKAQVSELELRVAERTADLQHALQRLQAESQERLRIEAEQRQMERQLAETQRLEGLGMLAGGVAHDFNNILTGIMASASVARLDAPPDSELHGHLVRIEENSRRAAGLCEQLLTYAGKGRVRVSSLDLNVLTRDTLELLHASIVKEECVTTLAPELPAVEGDASAVRQVLMNLVLNAAEALAAAPRQIAVQTKACQLAASALQSVAYPGDATPGEFVEIVVADTGSGMSSETLRRIFEPFYTTKFTGRGLGLCAVLGIIRRHGGALDVTSAEGRGTTFRVWFPVAKAPAAAGAPVVAAPLARASGTVLVVDDEESIRRIAAAVLRRQGFEVLVAQDGPEAIAVAQSRTSPLAGALIDLTMPKMDGASALVELRKIFPQLPAVLMSGFHRAETEERFRDLGNLSFLQKPFDVDELTRCVSEQFSGQSAGCCFST
jgi:two-component system, NtrC family, sensor kinase